MFYEQTGCDEAQPGCSQKPAINTHGQSTSSVRVSNALVMNAGRGYLRQGVGLALSVDQGVGLALRGGGKTELSRRALRHSGGSGLWSEHGISLMRELKHGRAPGNAEINESAQAAGGPCRSTPTSFQGAVEEESGQL